jgi:hypothetical protein
MHVRLIIGGVVAGAVLAAPVPVILASAHTAERGGMMQNDPPGPPGPPLPLPGGGSGSSPSAAPSPSPGPARDQAR